MSVYKQVFREAIDVGGEGKNLFHPTKLALYKNKHDVEQLFPDLGPEADRYLELVTSESYKQMLKKLEHYTGKPIGQFNLPVLMQMVMTALRRVAAAQRGHEPELERAAVDIVLSLPEFKMFKDLVASGAIKLDVKLQAPDLQNAVTEQDKKANQNELAPVEELNMIVAHELEGGDEGALKRKFANMITQGNAVNKFYLFNLAKETIDKIDPNLVNLYGMVSALVHASYYAGPMMEFSGAQAQQAAVGSEEVIPDGDSYIIKARSPFFPYLIHELVKGFYNYLSMDITSQKELEGETLDQETMQIMSGPQMYTNLSKMVPTKDAEYLPLVYKLLLQQDTNTIKTVLGGGARGQSIINKLLQQAKQSMEDYQSNIE